MPKMVTSSLTTADLSCAEEGTSNGHSKSAKSSQKKQTERMQATDSNKSVKTESIEY